MLYAVEVTATANSPMPLHRVFDLLSEPRPISQVFTADPRGVDAWHQVTGWNESDGPCPAWAALAEDSGDGVILLVYGGDDGIRLKLQTDPNAWNLNAPGQWGEPCLMLDKDTPIAP